MKKQLFLVLFIGLCISLFAQMTYTPYGSVRAGYWFENRDENLSGVKDGDFRSTYFLQTNSRFGVNFKQENFDARVEFNGDNASGNIGLRLLWAKQRFGSYTILVGQEEVLANQKANQVYGSNLDLVGYGAIDGGRRLQFRVDMDNGIYIALIQPNMVNPASAPSSPDFIIPMLNLGYNSKIGKLALAPAVVFQSFNYKEEKNDGVSGSVTSYLAAITTDYDANPVLLRLSVNYGSNTGNMGYAGPSTRASWNTEDEKTNDITTFGGWFTARYTLKPSVNFTGGLGIASSSNKDWKSDDNRMAFFVQSEIRMQRFRLIPEIGMLDEMKSSGDVKEGSLYYVGTQLRFDF